MSTVTYTYMSSQNCIQAHIHKRKNRQNGREMTSFRGGTAKLGAGVDSELGGLAPHQCR